MVYRKDQPGHPSVTLIFFTQPSGAFDSVGRLLAQAETPVFQAEEAKKGLIGLARDLRGLAYAFNTKTSYMMLFDWMYPCWLRSSL